MTLHTIIPGTCTENAHFESGYQQRACCYSLQYRNMICQKIQQNLIEVATCEIWGSHSGEDDSVVVMGFNAM
jgi:hypothetical protein